MQDIRTKIQFHKDIQHLITTKQFFAAVGKLVLREDTEEKETVIKVGWIVDKAIAMNTVGDLRKIMKQFDKWVDRETAERAVTALNETTDIDLHPDERD